ncbi:MAG TPA: LCP family protein [Candidatus Paceibacterota bacterium]|nr:LCP family protein [Candidatus Paceibacterota bacterium]
MTNRWIIGIIAAIICIVVGLRLASHNSLTALGGFHLSGGQTAAAANAVIPIKDDPEYAMPAKDQNRLDVLVLGIRGKDDVADGGSLTDTILLFSLDKTTGRATLTSIPRDLTVRITDTRTEKINTAYVLNGLSGAKDLFSRILGIKIDNVVVVDMTAFKDIVDQIGGVTVHLDKPFTEAQQWAGTASDSYVFSLPAGDDTLTGDQALYFARSRYSTSDFDRSRRQMQLIFAIKQKVDALHLTSDPLKAFQLLNTLRQHIDTDLNIFDIGTIRELISQTDDLANVRRYQLTTENVLYETMASGTYELLPRGGTLQHIKDFFSTVLDDTPTLWTPTPSPTPSLIPKKTP